MITRTTTDLQQKAADTLTDGLHEAGNIASSAFSRAASQMEEITRRGMDRAREVSTQARDQANRAGDRAVGYIQEEPVKAVLLAVVAGAAVAMLAAWFARSRASHL